MKYLYGAAVQGIQSFIFQTNKLKEIAGASELVEQICTKLFAETIGLSEESLKGDQNAIVTAAGNIKYIFDDEEQCKTLVRRFPKQVMEFAPGITISQAVVKVENEIEKIDIEELELRLRVQRNKPFRPFDIGLMAINRSRKTGLPAVEFIKSDNEYLNAGVLKKRKAIESEEKNNPEYGRLIEAFFKTNQKVKLALDFKYLTESKGKNYSWLAVVHADGNNMGITLQKLADYAQNIVGSEFIKLFRQFSIALDESTKSAAREAYLEVMKSCPVTSNDKLPFRPIIIGGDDLTLVCRADLALEFTSHFLHFFEEYTKKNFQERLPDKIKFIENGLTACAGIAFIKESYPFHYGYHLAETLCGEAKKAAKYGLDIEKLTPSCLMFHKVQDSFVEEFKEIKERELCAGKDDKKIMFDFGPYYLTSTQRTPTIEQLENNVKQFESIEGNAIKSHLRQWLTDLHNEPGLAEQKLERLVSTPSKSMKDILNKLKLPDSTIQNGKSPVYDWLTIHSINQGGQ